MLITQKGLDVSEANKRIMEVIKAEKKDREFEKKQNDKKRIFNKGKEGMED